MPLTDLAIKSAKPTTRRKKLSDGGGLHIEMSPVGTKTFKFSYRFGGKQKTLTGGRYPDMRLAQARAWREELKSLIREGIDPALEKRRERQRARLVAGDTFETLARDWHNKQKARWSPKHAAWIMKRFENDAFPLFGDLPVSQISHADILDLIARFERRDALEIGRKSINHVSAVMRHAIASGKASHNPVPDTSDSMRAKPPVRHRAQLPADELGEFYERLNSIDRDPTTKLAIRWTILTTVRTGETRFFKRKEIERQPDGSLLWRIPAERMKKQREHVVPLPRQAEKLLQEIDANARELNSEWQFPQRFKTRKPISENCMLLCLYELGYKGRATMHGFRGLASTVLNEQVDTEGRRRFDSDWIELQLAHVETNAVRGAYNAAEYLSARKSMMQWWADYLEEMELLGELL